MGTNRFVPLLVPPLPPLSRPSLLPQNNGLVNATTIYALTLSLTRDYDDPRRVSDRDGVAVRVSASLFRRRVQSALRHQSHLLRRNPCRSRQTSRPARAPRRFWIDRRPYVSPASLVPVRFRSERAGHVTLDRPWGNAAPRPVASSGDLVLGHGQHEKLVPALPMDSGAKRPLSSYGLVLADGQVDDRKKARVRSNRCIVAGMRSLRPVRRCLLTRG